MDSGNLLNVPPALIYGICIIIVAAAFVIIKILPKKKTGGGTGNREPHSLQQYISAVNEMIDHFNNINSVYSLAAEEKREQILKYEDTEALEKLAGLMDQFSENRNDAGNMINRIKDYLHDGQAPMNEYHSLGNDITMMEEYLKEIKEITPVRKEHDWNAGRTENVSEPAGEKTSAEDGYFHGCTTEAELAKRYRALCKVFHPDSTTGDTDAFRNLQAAYEKMKKEIAG